MLRNLNYICGWVLIISFSFSLTMHYPALAFAEDGPAAPATEEATAEATEPTGDQAAAESGPASNTDSSTENEKQDDVKAGENPAEAAGQPVQPGAGEALKPPPDSKTLSPEEAAKLRNSLKIKSRRKNKQTKEKDAEDSVMKRIFDAAEGKEKERFNVDYSPSKPDPATADEETPFYKHWIFWTIIGVGAVSGVVIGLKYGLSSNKSMSIDITRREP